VAYGGGYWGGYSDIGWSPTGDGLSVLVDWAKDGSFTTWGDDVTALVRGGFSVTYGRDQATAVAPLVSGSGGFTLDNVDRRFSSRNSASLLFGKLKPGRPVLIARTVNGGTTILFRGHTDDQPLNPDADSKTVSLSLVDSLADFQGQSVNIPLQAGLRTGAAIGAVLDACAWPTALRDLDPGATVIPWFWADNKDAGQLLDELVRSEGSPAGLWIGSDGSIVFRDRHHRLIRSASTTVQATLRGGSSTVEPLMSRDFTYNENWQNVLNTGSVSVDVRTPQPLQVVWSSDTPLALSAGEQTVITASTSDPFYGAIPPQAGVDYTTAGGAITTSLTRTSGGSAGIVITAAGATVVSALQLRAQPVTVAYSVQVSDSDAQSIADYGARAFPSDLPWCGRYDAQAVVSSTVAQRAQPLTQVTTSIMCGVNVPRTQATLALDLSDRVHVVEAETVTDADFYVETIGHTAPTIMEHKVTLGLEAVPVPVTPTLRFDTAGAGFDQGKFGSGLADGSNMFIFDAGSGHRFDEGVFAT
jgi:hypothetical protein